MLTEERSDGSKQSGVLNDWDRAEELESLSQRCRMVSEFRAILNLSQDDTGNMAIRVRDPDTGLC